MRPLDYPQRAFRIARYGFRTLFEWRTLSQSLGIRPALTQLVRAKLSLDSMGSRLDDLTHAIEAQAARTAAVEAEQARAEVGQRAALDNLGFEVQRGVVGAAATTAGLKALTQRLQALEGRMVRNEELESFSRWISETAAPSDEKVSVILATRNRAPLLPRAAQSVLAQDHHALELVIVDDGSTDDTPRAVEALCNRDPRVKALRTEHGGPSRARNQGLAMASGKLIAYVDDDNWMLAGWLRALVWAFEQRRDVDVLYGARLVDYGTQESKRPVLHFEPYDRSRLAMDNFIDLGVVAHRARLAEARFDETLSACVDWDLVLRLTQDKPPLALPVIASAYSVTAPNRIFDRPDPLRAVEAVRQRHRRAGPKILAYNAMFPLITETYVADELAALERCGAELAFCRERRSSSPIRFERPLHLNLEAAVREFDPDLLFLYWADHAFEHLDRLTQLRRPFAVRIHSFDFSPEKIAGLRAHPFCAGVWAYPHHARQVPGTYALPSLFTSVDALPPPAPQRDLVLSVSASLPKKDWDLLIRGLNDVEGAERRIVIGMTNAFAHLPTELTAKLGEYDHPPLLQVNLAREEIFALLSRTAALVYTLVPTMKSFGNPMSVIEAMCAGASVVVPDRTEARELCGPAFRSYTTAADLTVQVHEILRGGPQIEAERAAGQRYARERHCGLELQRRFFDEVCGALVAWNESGANGLRGHGSRQEGAMRG